MHEKPPEKLCFRGSLWFLRLFLQLTAQFIVQFLKYAFRTHFIQELSHLQDLFIGQLPVSGDIPELRPDNVKTDRFHRVFLRDHAADFAAGVRKADQGLVQQTVREFSALIRVGVNDLLIFIAVNNCLQNRFCCSFRDLCRRHRRGWRAALRVGKACCQFNGL